MSAEGALAIPEAAGKVELVMPSGRAWHPVVRLVLGGVADRLDLGFEELDDLQLAVERLLVEAAPPGSVRFCFELIPGGVRATIGPLREDVISAALQGLPPAPGELSLRRILEAVVDSYGIAGSEDGDLTVRLIKARRR